MSYQIEFTQTAKEDLRNIAFYIAEESKEISIAVRFVEELQNSIGQLKNFPRSGACPKDRVLCSFGYRFLVHKEYLTFYTVDEEKKIVYIEAVFNSKKDYTRILLRLL